jgi:hypothetical protein
MGFRTYLSIVTAVLVTSCAHYKQDHKDLTHPLSNPPRVCLGNLTQSPEENQTLSPAELYGCAEDLYKWAIDFDCPMKNDILVNQQLEEALENINVIPKDQRPDGYSGLEEQIKNLKRGLIQNNSCQ